MAMLLAPYNHAMRLGMGFNSFTQQMCINDAVRTRDGSATKEERQLRPQYKLGTMTAADGVADVSQVVTFTAKFVDRISEVTDSMNISGSLEIKCDAIGGGGGAEARFTDANKFKESDLNYFIQVKVTNEKLVAPDLTEFCPIPNVPDSEFTRVYGDSFISGFLEGGDFNALISIKLKDRSKAKELGGKLKVEMDLKATSITGEAEGGKKDFESSYDGETTIAVSWSGGGDIKDGTVTDWTLETLKSVAMEFPEHVMACPLRTNAILTKYTALRSFYEKQLKGSPLDYENAGVYSSALLDAYMDYKVMWRNIQTWAWEIEQGQSTLIVAVEDDELAEYRSATYAHYKKQLTEYQQKIALPAPKSDPEQERKQISPPPPPPSDVKALPAPETPANGAPVPNSSANGIESSAALTNGSTPAESPTPAQPTALAVSTVEPASVRAASRTPHSEDAQSAAIARVRRKPSLEPPLPPNDMAPYKPTILGLDRARRDCRFEMIKIVREVDAVAEDPKVACDPSRTWQYLSPAVFRLLLPHVHGPPKETPEQQAKREAAEKAKKDMEEEIRSLKQRLSAERDGSKDSLTKTEEKIKELSSTNERLQKEVGDLSQAKAALDQANRSLNETVSNALPQYNGYCPVPLNTTVRFHARQTNRSMDYDEATGRFHIWEAHTGVQQQFVIVPGRAGYRIRARASNKFVTSGAEGPNMRFYLTMGDVGSEFTFHPTGDGAYCIYLADPAGHYDVNPEHGRAENGTLILLWPHGANENSKWLITTW